MNSKYEVINKWNKSKSNVGHYVATTNTNVAKRLLNFVPDIDLIPDNETVIFAGNVNKEILDLISEFKR